MLQRIKSLLELNSLRIAIASTLLILVLSLIKTDGIPKIAYHHIDKVEHAIAYTFMSFFWMLSSKLKLVNVHFKYLALFMIFFGIIIELLQMYLIVGRTGDVLDVFANSLGVFLGYIVLRLLGRLYLEV